QDVPDKTWMNITKPPGGTGVVVGDDFSTAGVFAVGTGGKNGSFSATSNDDIIWALSHNGGTGTHPGGVLLGDGDGNGATGSGSEVTLLLTKAQVAADFANPSTSSAVTIMLNQLIAAQLNIYNGDHDPGALNLSSNPGHDLVGEGVLWLQGALTAEPGTPTTTTPTSSPLWTSKFYDTGIYETALGHNIMVSGQDLKNVLEAFNQDHIVTTSDLPASLIGWSNDGVHIVGAVHPNTPNAFWLVAYEHGLVTG